MEDIIKKFEENKLLLKLSKKVYEKDAVFSAAYKFTDKCTILIEPIGEKHIGVYFEPKKDNSDSNLEKIANEFCNEVLDQQLRLDLEVRYGNIRELTVQHAFVPLKELKKAIQIP